MKLRNKYFAVLLLACSTNMHVAAQTTAAAIQVTGAVATPLNIQYADLQTYEQVNVTRKDKDGKDHQYSGVALSAILDKAGATMGAQLKGKNLAKYVLVSARDGYQVVFALAELDKMFTDRAIILADKVDGNLIPDTDGPFRIIVQDEKKPARCVRQVASIKVISAE